MDCTSSTKNRSLALAAGQNQDRSGLILAVGEVSAWRGRGNVLPRHGQLAFAEFHEVTAELLETLSPALVLSPLLSRRFDCVDLAELLHVLGYRGKYRVIGNDLPNPDLITAEVMSLVPGLDFAVTRLTDAV